MKFRILILMLVLVLPLMAPKQITISSASSQKANEYIEFINVSDSRVIDNIQFNYTAIYRTALDKSVSHIFNISFSIVFFNFTPSTTITRAVLFENTLSAYRTYYDFNNYTKALNQNFYYINASKPIIQNNTVTFNESAYLWLSNYYNQSYVFLSPTINFVYALNGINNQTFVIWKPVGLAVFGSQTVNTERVAFTTIFMVQFVFVTLVPLMIIIYFNKKIMI